MRIYKELGFPTTLPDVDDVVVVRWTDQLGNLCLIGARIRSIHYNGNYPKEIFFSLDVAAGDDVEGLVYRKEIGKYSICFDETEREATVSFYE